MRKQQLKAVWVVIPAAGIGQRMESEIPKQYLKIFDKTIVEHTLDCFLHHQQVAGVVIVLSIEDQYWQTLNIQSESLFPVRVIVNDDSSRSDSVMQGLNYLHEDKGISADSWVMVHDAARPCLSEADIDSLLAIREFDCAGGILASPVRDTMKRSVQDELTAELAVSYTEPRVNLWHALTPQMFKLGELTDALKYCHSKGETVTDECSAMEFKGVNPLIISGSSNNIKVTYPDDIELATFLINKKQFRVN